MVRLTARDNLAELAYISMKDGTYTANGTDALINTIIRAHAKTIGATGIDLPAINSNTADFTTSLRVGGRTYVAKSDTKSVLEVIQHLADSDPWNANYSGTENYGYAFWLDAANDFHYHQLGTWPTTAPVAYGLGIVYGLAADTDIKKVMKNPGAWDDTADEAIGEVNISFTGKIEDADTGVTKTLRLKRFTHGTVGGSGYPFHANDEILGLTNGGVTGSGSVAKVQLVTSGAILVSHVDEGDNEVPTFTPGETLVVTKVDRNGDGVYSNGSGLGGNDDEIGVADSEQAPYKYSASGTTATTHLTTAGASAPFTTTPDLEGVQTRVAYIRPQEYQSFDTPIASARAAVSQVADYYARRGFIDVSADTFAKGTLQITGYPTYMYTGSVHIPVRAGEHIYVANSVTTSVAGNYNVSRIVFTQNVPEGTYGSTIYVANNNGSNTKITAHESSRSLAKNASALAIDVTGRGQVSLFDTATSSGYVPTESYGTFRYSVDGGGGSADTLGFLTNQQDATPAQDTNESAFWSMLSEHNGVSGSNLIFEPIVDYGSTDSTKNRAFIGYHNPLFGIYSYYLNSGNGTATFPSHTFSTDVDTGMYRVSSNIVGFSAGNVPVAGFWGSRDTSDAALPINGGGLYPQTTNVFDLGTASYLWDDVYATNGTIQTSDARLKEHITPTTLGLDFINDLNPVSYKWKRKNENKMDQTHYGIVAQEVMETLTKYGINSVEDFGGITHEGGEEDYYGARYGEFVPILIKAVQELSAEVKDLKEKL
tara:strand:- start:239 stop:2539 length:2301 start_codon:yes stop_codon:yes gene_type:complete